MQTLLVGKICAGEPGVQVRAVSTKLEQAGEAEMIRSKSKEAFCIRLLSKM